VRVEYHPAVAQDVAEALRGYASVSERLGEEFKAELRRVIALAAEKPGRFHPITPRLHRANLKRFPYHVLYRELADGIRITLLRHNRRDPHLGMDRV
jgi:toxin ParE1/3/4